MKSCEEITKSLLERRDGYLAAQKKKRQVFGMVASLCCLCLLVLMCFAMGGPQSGQPEQTGGTVLQQGGSVPVDATYDEKPEDPAANNTIVVNNIAENPQLMYIALMWDDFVAMTQEELTAYYGVDYVPEVPADLQTRETHSGIYKRGGGTGEVYCDRNRLEYSNEDQSRAVSLTVAKGRIPVLFGMPTDAEPEKSVIQNREVTIFQPEEGIYFAEFLLGDAGFVVFACGLTQEELVGVLASLIQ